MTMRPKNNSYTYHVNQDSDSVINVKNIQEYRQGIRGAYKAQKNPSKEQDFETSKIYVGYFDLYIGHKTPEGDVVALLSDKHPFDTIYVTKVEDNDPLVAFKYENNSYKITMRNRFTRQGQMVCVFGFDFENTKPKLVDGVYVFDPLVKGDDETKISDLIGCMIYSSSKNFQIRKDGDMKLMSARLAGDNIVVSSSCSNIIIESMCSDIDVGNNCCFINIWKNCNSIKIDDGCQNITIKQNCGGNGGKIYLGSQCGSCDGNVLIGEGCANTDGALISIGGGDSETFAGEDIEIAPGIQKARYINK